MNADPQAVDFLTRPKTRRFLRILVYVMLVSSAATTFFLSEELWARAHAGSLPNWAPLIPPLLFTAFVLIFAVDRWILVRRHAYPPGRAVFQVGFALVFLTLLWPTQASEFRKTRRGDPLTAPSQRLLTHADAEVRAAACELAGLKGNVELEPVIAKMMQFDPSPAVRAECATAHRHLKELLPP